jgi:hypothetical protein
MDVFEQGQLFTYIWKRANGKISKTNMNSLFSRCHIANHVMTPQVTKRESYNVNKMICNVLQMVMFLIAQLIKLHIEIKLKNECVCVLGKNE